MDWNTVSLIVTVIGTGIALYMAIVPGQKELRREVGELRERMTHDVGELRERMARLEGLFEGFTQGRPPRAEERRMRE